MIQSEIAPKALPFHRSVLRLCREENFGKDFVAARTKLMNFSLERASLGIVRLSQTSPDGGRHHAQD